MPYISDHLRISHNMPYAALMGAARLCYNVHNFNSEKIRIVLSLLLNNYPSHLVKKQFYRFFQRNDAMLVWQELNESLYH